MRYIYSQPYPVYPRLYVLKLKKEGANKVDEAHQVDAKSRDKPDKKQFLYCKACHYPITYKSARSKMNQKHQHVFANPHGYIYQIACFSQAPGCIITGEASSHFSWFPGYTWQIALCMQCWTLLGWAFCSDEHQFFGLIFDKLSHIE